MTFVAIGALRVKREFNRFYANNHCFVSGGIVAGLG